MNRIVVTGALGHIGSSLIRSLPGFFPDHEMVLIDNLFTQRYSSLFCLPPQGRYRFIESGILDFPFEDFLGPGDRVVHLAALTVPQESIKNPQETDRVNYEGTRRIAHACAVKGASLVFFSTTSIYNERHTDEDSPFSGLTPTTPYGHSKLKAEQFLKCWGSENNLSFNIFRFGTIFGVSPGMRFHTAVNRFCWQASLGKPLSVWRTALDQRRPYLDLKDAVNTIAFWLHGKLEDGQIYNAVTGSYTVRDIFDILQEENPGTAFELVDSPMMTLFSTDVSADRLMARGFEFRGSLREGIQETMVLLRKAAGDPDAIPHTF